MIERVEYLHRLEIATKRSPVTALLGPRQVGKTTLSRQFSEKQKVTFFDLESESDRRRLENPELVLSSLDGLVVLDEIQILPDLFNTLRVLVDNPQNQARYIILGSASPQLIRHASDSLAGRVEFVELDGFNLIETGFEDWKNLWLRGGFPRSFLASSNDDSQSWRESFVRTFLERDLPELGINIPASAMRRFWSMLANYHGQVWNASELSRAMGLSDKTVRSYLDILTGSFMVRQLQPWFVNIGKRQVKAPKIYLRDSGLLHTLLNLTDFYTLIGHPKVGASWEGYVIEQFLSIIQPPEAYFWSVHGGAELDLMFPVKGKRFGIEAKFSEAPAISRSIHTAIEDLELHHLWLVYPGDQNYPVSKKISVLSIKEIASIAQMFNQ